MESGFEDDFAPMQSSSGVVEDAPFILGEDEEESPKKASDEGKLKKLKIKFFSIMKYFRSALEALHSL